MKAIAADWPAPKNVYAFTSTRLAGVSTGIYQGLNLAQHVQDNPQLVKQNRQLFAEYLNLPSLPIWLQQVHGTEVVEAKITDQPITADASYSLEAGRVCAVLTADCLPVFFTNQQGTQVAVAHAGWRGLAAGILEKTLAKFSNPAEVLCWFGPGIGAEAFEVGAEVRTEFCQQQPAAEQCFKQQNNDKWLADIYALARLRLQSAGVQQISGGDYCTYQDKEQFYSYRRDGETGRIASLIWFES